MTALRVVLARLRGLLRRDRPDAELAEEFETHLALLADEHVARGLSPDEARVAARRDFGGVDQVRSACRDQAGLPSVDSLLEDLRLAGRSIVRDPAFAITATVVLGIGLGVTHLFLTIVYVHTMRGLPVERPDRLLYISAIDQLHIDRPLSRAEFDALEAGGTAFANVVAFAAAPVNVSDDGRGAERFDGGYIGPGAFASVGARPVLGRDFEPDDHRPGAAPVALLGRTAWRTRYGEDRDILGRTILVNEAPVTIVGIMPDASGFPSTAAVWLPLHRLPGLAAPPQTMRRLRVIGRLRGDATLAEAREQVEAVFAGLAEQAGSATPMRGRAVPINERLLGRLEGPWLAFLIAGCVIVLIACANVGNLLLARGVGRAREVALRTALGASRARIVRQLLAESLLLAGVGGLAGLAVSAGAVRLFSRAIPAGTLPYWLAYSFDTRLLAVLVGLSTASALAFGLVPALLLSRTDVHAVLKDGGRSRTASRAGRPWMTAFLSLEIGLAVVLLATIAVSSLALRSRLPGDRVVETSQAVAATVTLPVERYESAGARRQYLEQVIARTSVDGRVSSASATAVLPLGGGAERVLMLGSDTPAGSDRPAVLTVEVGPAYFGTLGLPVVRGREFTPTDAGTDSVLVNERFVDRFLGGREPIGAHVSLTNRGDTSHARASSYAIIGVVPDLRQRTRPTDAEPIVYLPLMTAPPATVTLVVRAPSANDAAARLRASALAIDPLVPLYRTQTVAQAMRDADWNPRLSSQLANTLTGLCILLAAVGLYSVTAHGVSLRRRELGIRVVLGATSWRVLLLVVSGTRLPIGLGALLGIGGALAWERAFPPGQAQLGVSHPAVIGLVVALVGFVSVVACLGPARRAVTMDPALVLRED